MHTGIASIAVCPSADRIVAGGGSGLVEWYSLKTLAFIGSSNHRHQVGDVLQTFWMLYGWLEFFENKFLNYSGGAMRDGHHHHPILLFQHIQDIIVMRAHHYLMKSSTQLQVRSVCMDPRLDSGEDVAERKCSVLAGGGKFNIQGPPEGELFLVSREREREAVYYMSMM